jgi:kumamolisin
MRRAVRIVPGAIGALLVGFVSMCSAQGGPIRRQVVVPQSSIENPGDAGIKAHTNVLVVPIAPIRNGGNNGPLEAAALAAPLPPFAGYYYDTPASIACVYNLVTKSSRGFCNPNTQTHDPTGGARAIALVDAYDDPYAAADLETFSRQFGLPSADFTVVYASGRRPLEDPTGGWELEESLDVQWSHALAPHAAIFLVEAASSQLSDLFSAELVAADLVAERFGAGEVSNGWGGSEFSTEKSYDVFFTRPDVVYLAAVGDSPGVDYPATSPNVIAAGGTSLNRDFKNGALTETAWQDSGGGPSVFEQRPAYQDKVASIVGNVRGTPDVAFSANPNNGVWVYDSFPVELEVSYPVQFSTGWLVVGGTSVSTTALAGIINSRGKFRASSAGELDTIYTNLKTSNFFDIASGNCGPYGGYPSATGWDFCTGVGSSDGLGGF